MCYWKKQQKILLFTSAMDDTVLFSLLGWSWQLGERVSAISICFLDCTHNGDSRDSACL